MPLQPGMTKDKAAPPRCVQAFFFFQTNHRAGLQTELDGFGFEQHLSADQSDQFAVLLAHRTDRIVTQHGGPHGIHDWHLRREIKRTRNSNISRDHTDEMLVLIDNKQVGNECGPRCRQFLCRCGPPWSADERRREPVPSFGRSCFQGSLIAHPLLAHLGRSRRNDLLTAFARKAFEDILGER